MMKLIISKAGIIDGTSALRGVIPIDKDLRQIPGHLYDGDSLTKHRR